MRDRTISIINATILLSCSIGLFVIAVNMKSVRAGSSDGDCWSIPLEQSTGTIRCWSGGVLVYQNSIYYNGGVLCSTIGKEINISGSKSLCIIESNQVDVWNPPAKR